MAVPAPKKEKDRHWAERLTRSGYFFGALLLHLTVFAMVATYVIWKPFVPPTDDFTKPYGASSAPPRPPPPPQQSVQVPTHTVAPPTAVIATIAPSVSFNIPMPDFTHPVTPDDAAKKMTEKVTAPTANLSMARLSGIMATEKGWGRDPSSIRSSNGDPHNVTAKFPV